MILPVIRSQIPAKRILKIIQIFIEMRSHVLQDKNLPEWEDNEPTNDKNNCKYSKENVASLAPLGVATHFSSLQKENKR